MIFVGSGMAGLVACLASWRCLAALAGLDDLARWTLSGRSLDDDLTLSGRSVDVQWALSGCSMDALWSPLPSFPLWK